MKYIAYERIIGTSSDRLTDRKADLHTDLHTDTLTYTLTDCKAFTVKSTEWDRRGEDEM